jgi:hypothetical protein
VVGNDETGTVGVDLGYNEARPSLPHKHVGASNERAAAPAYRPNKRVNTSQQLPSQRFFEQMEGRAYMTRSSPEPETAAGDGVQQVTPYQAHASPSSQVCVQSEPLVLAYSAFSTARSPGARPACVTGLRQAIVAAQERSSGHRAPEFKQRRRHRCHICMIRCKPDK